MSSYTAFVSSLAFAWTVIVAGAGVGVAFSQEAKPQTPSVDTLPHVPLVDEDIEKFRKKPFGKLLQAERFGIQPYGPLKYDLRGTCLEAHHLLEQRFAPQLGRKPREMLAVALTEAEHRRFTNAWRRAIPYGARTRKATLDQIHGTACRIYRRYPAFLNALEIACPSERPLREAKE